MEGKYEKLCVTIAQVICISHEHNLCSPGLKNLILGLGDVKEYNTLHRHYLSKRCNESVIST